ncbi:MAG: thioredoxin fold domain-containing protein [Pseudomonadota bacterium]|uniref:thioredoxin fold domain-containing protein n=1 Tax=Polaromonas sp. YR568 TaxID=1855301 RepID=UPI00271FA35E|nr:thioredoxin fold domain-containing protein [Polaromonas sp.]MDO9259120.1 thioredoxin fold domain-containing protein [Polaromonas sp.]
MSFQPFQILPAMLVAATLLLTACQDTPAPDAKAKAGTTAVSTAVVAAEAKGFSVGSTLSTRTVYVFFDAQCPHCNALWVAAKPLKAQAKFVWIPVGILNASSTAQGATLLAAKDPAAAMDEHEASMQAKGGGISAGSDIAAQKEVVAKNTALLTRLGFGSIPTIIGTHAQSGALVTQEGSMPTAALAALLGLQVPAAP